MTRIEREQILRPCTCLRRSPVLCRYYKAQRSHDVASSLLNPHPSYPAVPGGGRFSSNLRHSQFFCPCLFGPGYLCVVPDLPVCFINYVSVGEVGMPASATTGNDSGRVDARSDVTLFCSNTAFCAENQHPNFLLCFRRILFLGQKRKITFSKPVSEGRMRFK